MDDDKTLALMPAPLREAVEHIAATFEVDVFYNVRRHEAMLLYINPGNGEDSLISVAYYPETGKTHIAEARVPSDWTTGFEG